MSYLITFLISLVFVLMATPILEKVAPRWGYVDFPGERKVHLQPTPLLGGVAVFLGCLLSMFVGLSLESVTWGRVVIGFVAGGMIILLLGLIDDRRGMSPGLKILGQLAAALAFILASGGRNLLLGQPLDLLTAILWMVGLMNALNFLDNMDGLASGVALLAALGFLVVATFSNIPVMAVVAASLAGAMAGFLRYNFVPASIFLGDAGSLFIGYVLASLGLMFAQGHSSHFALLVPVLILSYPIFDTTLVTLARIRERRRLTKGAKDHSSHRMAELGMEAKGIVLRIYGICLLLAVTGVLVYTFLDSPVVVLIFVAVGLALTLLGVHLNRRFARIGEKLALLAGDVVVINLAFLALYWLRFRSGMMEGGVIIPLDSYLAPTGWLMIYWVVLLAGFGLYDFSADLSLSKARNSILKVVSVGVGLVFLFTLDLSHPLTGSKLLIFPVYWLTLAVGLFLHRWLLLLIGRKLYSLGLRRRRAMIIGATERSRELAEYLRRNGKLGYQLVGFEGYEDLRGMVRRGRVEETIIADLPNPDGTLEEIMAKCAGMDMEFKISLHLRPWVRGMKTGSAWASSLLRVFPSPLRSWEWGVKRGVDVTVSLFVLVLSAPLRLLAKLRGERRPRVSSLVKEERMGKGGNTFGLYTFSEEMGFPRSLADIPQYFNVLKGNMSLVGPRARPPDPQSAGVKDTTMARISLVRPGITGLAQIRGRKEGSEEEMEDDLDYLECISLGLDLRILCRKVISSVGRGNREGERN